MADIEITDEMLVIASKAWLDTRSGPMDEQLRAAIKSVAPIISKAAKSEMRETCAQVVDARKPLYELQGQLACVEIASSIRALEIEP